MNESQYRTKMCKEFRRLGCIVIPIVGHGAGGSGYPDTFIISRNIDFFLEFKGYTTKLRPIQKEVLRRINAKKTPAYILRAPGILENYEEEHLADVRRAIDVIRYILAVHAGSAKE